MKKVVTIILAALALATIVIACQKKETAEEPKAMDQPAITQTANIGPVIKDREVEAACGQCKLSLEGGGCDLAVRFDGQAYYVDGTTINDHGDAHGLDGFCTVIRKAIVSGQVEGDRFVVASFKVLPSGG